MRRKPCAGLLLAVFLAALLIGGAVEAQAQQAKKKKLTLERLYRFPKLEGTAPIQPKWAEDGSRIAFLWNDEGMPFRDLWVYEVASGEKKRLTRLPHDPDEWTTPASHKDKRLKKYLPQNNGLRNFQWASDSRAIVFTYRGELYLLDVTGRIEMTRLTKTKGSEANPRFSPAERRLAYVRGGELYVFDGQTLQTVQLTSNGGLDIEEEGSRQPGNRPGTFKWSPDGKWIAFQQVDNSGVKGRLVVNYSGERVRSRNQSWRIAREGNSKTRLGVVPAGGGSTVWLTKKSDDYYYDWEWSGDSSRIAMTRVEENQKKRHIDVIDVEVAIAKATADKETAESAKKNAEEEKKELTTEGTEATEEKKKKEAYKWIRTLYSETDDKWICTLCNFVEWSPDGAQVLFSSERDGWNHLYLISDCKAEAADGAEKKAEKEIEKEEQPAARCEETLAQLTRGQWEVEARGAAVDLTPKFSADGQTVYYTSNQSDPSERDLYRVSVSGGEPERITVGKGFNAAVLPKGGIGTRVAFLHSSFDTPWDLQIKANNPMVPAVTSITHSPLREFQEYDWPQPRIVEFPARDPFGKLRAAPPAPSGAGGRGSRGDGKTVRALLFFPPSIPVDAVREIRMPGKRTRPSRRRPVPKVPIINFVHGAGYAQAVLNRWGGYFAPRFQFNQFASQQGYFVIDVDYRGSSGYGRDWRTDVYLHLGGLDLQDELAAMDYLRTLRVADLDRAGVWGVSYGGFMTLMAMFNSPDTFKAGSAWASVTDWENYNRSYTQQRLRTPKEEPEAYQRSSPVHHVEGLKGALQLQHGVGDSNVHFQDIMQLTDALVHAGKPFTQQFYPQSNHGWARPEVWLHSTRAMFAFFEKHLKGAAPRTKPVKK